MFLSYTCEEIRNVSISVIYNIKHYMVYFKTDKILQQQIFNKPSISDIIFLYDIFFSFQDVSIYILWKGWYVEFVLEEFSWYFTYK